MNVTHALTQLEGLLPSDTPDKEDGEYCLQSVEHYMYYDEPELALGAIVYIAEAHCQTRAMLDPTFWTSAKKLADHLAKLNLDTTFADSIADITETIDAHLD